MKFKCSREKFLICQIDSTRTTTPFYWKCHSIFTDRWESRCRGTFNSITGCFLVEALTPNSGHTSLVKERSFFTPAYSVVLTVISDATQIPGSMGTPTAQPPLQIALAQQLQ